MTNIYSEIYSLIIGLFGGADYMVFNGAMAHLLSTFACVFVFLVPFIVVYNIIKFFAR